MNVSFQIPRTQLVQHVGDVIPVYDTITIAIQDLEPVS